jgi:succinoglycan biosynthesis transport protein ExoP
MDLQTLLRVIRRRLGVILLAIVLVPVAAYARSATQQKQYSASASLLFRDPHFDQSLFGANFWETIDPAREAATNLELVGLRVVADRTAKALDIGITGRQVEKKIEISAEGQADVVSVTATDPDRRFAARLANAFARQFILFRRAADRANLQEAERLIQSQIDALPPEEREGAAGKSLRERQEQLQVLASLQTGNAELVQAASPPGSPSQPRIRRNTAVGVFLGLILAGFLTLLLERLDRRLRDVEDIEQAFECPVLGAIPESRQLQRRDRQHQDSWQLPGRETEAFLMLRAGLRYFNVNREIKSVLITSAAPGDGKTTIAYNLAASASFAGDRALLIESDLRHPNLARMCGATPNGGLSEVLAGEISFPEATVRVPISREGERANGSMMDVLFAGGIPPNPVDLIESTQMHALLVQAIHRYDLVVLDTPPTSIVSDAIPLVNRVDGVIAVTRLKKSTRDSVKHLRTQLEQLGAPLLGVVINGVGSEAGYYGYYGYGYYGASGSKDGEGSKRRRKVESKA